jgi:hypothetical protein
LIRRIYKNPSSQKKARGISTHAYGFCRLETKKWPAVFSVLPMLRTWDLSKDPDRRAPCERRALKLTHQFMSSCGSITSTDGARQLAETLL